MKPWLRALLKTCAYAALAVCCYLLQACVFSRLPLAGARPLLLPAAAVGVALFEGPGTGALFGLFSGILCDSALGEPAILFTLMLTAFGLGVGALGRRLLRQGLSSYLAAELAVSVLCALGQCLGYLLYETAPIALLIQSAALQAAYSAAVSIPLYWLCRGIGLSGALKGTS
jgi:hypothetical protein